MFNLIRINFSVMSKKKIYIWIAVIALISVCVGAFFVSPLNPVPTRPVLTVSIQPQKYFLDKLVGDKYQVMCLLDNGSNPESYEPSVSNLMSLERSEAYFCIGNIGFESAILEKMKSNNPDLIVIDTSRGIELLRGTHSGVHSHKHCCGHEVDPHVWTSVKNAKQIVVNMYETLIVLDSYNKAEYTKNFNSLMYELDEFMGELESKMEPSRGSAFAVWHPSLSYFARDYGLKQIAMENEGKEVSASALKQEIDMAREMNVKVLFYQKEFDSRQIQTINSQLGSDMIEINPMSYEWVEEMKKIADAISTR